MNCSNCGSTRILEISAKVSDRGSYTLEDSDVSVYRYKVIFKPTTIIPDIDLSVPN